MPQFIRVAPLNNPVEGALAGSLLAERGIPHAIAHFEDSAFGGIFAAGREWGGVDAPAEYREEIIALLDEMRSAPESDGEPRA